jgi:hypothetical protein
VRGFDVLISGEDEDVLRGGQGVDAELGEHAINLS